MEAKITTIGKINYIAVNDKNPYKTLHYTFPSDEAWKTAKEFAKSHKLEVCNNAGFHLNEALFTFSKIN